MAELKKKFTMSYADLTMKSVNILSNVRRDWVYFEARGVTNADILAYEALIDQLRYASIDETYLYDIVGEVEEKAKARQTALVQVRNLSGYFEQQWGRDSWQYNGLNIAYISTKSESDFVSACRYLAEAAQNELATLSAIGLTQAEIDSLTSAVDLMESKMKSKLDAMAARRKETEARIALGNDVFSAMKKFCSIGKLIWEDENISHYEDYLLYKGKGRKKKKGDVKKLNEDSTN